MEVFVKQSSNYFSPFRYPGGKSSLSSFLGEVVNQNNLHNYTYVEPFAGGAGAALDLLFLEKIKAIHINDYDQAIYSIWFSILNHTDRFVNKIRSTPISIDEWHKQKKIYNSNTKSLFKLGFATFYLNRTNRSGIITGGPIGGINQNGKYKINARYHKERLIKRITKISSYKKRIKITNIDGVSLINSLDHSKHFYYVDPPYYVKGKGLYLNHFDDQDHQNLANCLNENSRAFWILTYDNIEEISSLYLDRLSVEFSLNYFAGDVKKGKEIMIFSDSVNDVINPENIQRSIFN